MTDGYTSEFNNLVARIVTKSGKSNVIVWHYSVGIGSNVLKDLQDNKISYSF